jgi:hypothetical protein
MRRWTFLLLLLLPGVAGANAPYVSQACGQAQDFANHILTMHCHLENTTSGDTIIVSVSGDTTTVVPTATETLTCPAGAVITNSIYRIYTCYVATASSHSAFDISVTASGGTGQGIFHLIAEEVQGLGAIDASASGGSSTSPASITTAANNEWVHQACWMTAKGAAVAAPFTQVVMASAYLTSVTVDAITGREVAAASGAQSVGCTPTSVSFFGGISVLAFAQSSPPVLPSQNVVQWCMSSNADTASGCILNNVTSGNKVLFLNSVQGPGASTVANGCLANGSSTTCVCPSSAQVQASYTLPQGATNIITAACYADLASSFTTFQPLGTCASCFLHALIAEEINGVNTGVDAPSEASATATTVNYTTAANNEFTMCAAVDYGASPANAQVPGNSFNSSGSGAYDNNTRGAGQTTDILAQKKTASSGANTCSYTQTGSTNPQIVTMSFTLPLAASQIGAFIAGP